MEGGSATPGSFSPRAVDLDGDGVSEIVLRHREHPERIAVYRWSPRDRR
jgi:hypothetical protein